MANYETLSREARKSGKLIVQPIEDQQESWSKLAKDLRFSPVSLVSLLLRVFWFKSNHSSGFTDIKNEPHSNLIDHYSHENLPLPERSRYLGIKMQRLYDDDCRHGNYTSSIMSAIWRSYKWHFIVANIISSSEKFLLLLRVIFLNRLSTNLELYVDLLYSDNSNKLLIADDQAISSNLSTNAINIESGDLDSQISIGATFMCIFGLMNLVAKIPNEILLEQTGNRIRIALSHMIYRKSLRLNLESMEATSRNQLLIKDLNLWLKSCTKFTQSIMSTLGSSLLLVTISTLMLINFGFKFTMICYLVIGLSISMSEYSSKFDEKMRKKLESDQHDDAIQIESLISDGEPGKLKGSGNSLIMLRLLNRITDNWSSLYFIIRYGLKFTSSKMIAFLPILVYLFTERPDGPITTGRLFFALNLLSILHEDCIKTILDNFVTIFEMIHFSNQIEQFLILPELAISPVTYKFCVKTKPDLDAIVFRGTKIVGFGILNLRFRRNEVVFIVDNDTTSNDHSSKNILLTILGEHGIQVGSLEINGKLSYASREPWIFDKDIRHNIVVGKIFDPIRYDDVIKACCLQDLVKNSKQNAYNLSTSYKKRINLARCLYQQAEIYLLDGVFDDLEEILLNEIYSKAIERFLANKTIVITITNNPRFTNNASSSLLSKGDYFIVLHDDGTIENGTYDKIKEKLSDNLNKVVDETDSSDVIDSNVLVSDSSSYKDNEYSSAHGSLTGLTNQLAIEMQEKYVDNISHNNTSASIDNTKQTSDNIDIPIQSEPTKRQHATWLSHVRELALSRPIYPIGLIFGLIISQILYHSVELIVCNFIESRYQKHDDANGSFMSEFNRFDFTNIYAIMILLCLLSQFIWLTTLISSSTSFSVEIYRKLVNLFKTIASNPKSNYQTFKQIWWDTYRDASMNLEFDIPGLIASIICDSFTILGSFILIFAIQPINFISIILVCVSMFATARYFINFLHLMIDGEKIAEKCIDEGLENPWPGLVTMRLFRIQDQFVRDFDCKLDHYTSVRLPIMLTQIVALSTTSLCLIIGLAIMTYAGIQSINEATIIANLELEIWLYTSQFSRITNILCQIVDIVPKLKFTRHVEILEIQHEMEY